VALFQKSVQNDYLNRVQDSSIKEYWECYDSYFNNPEQQKLIEQVSERKFYAEFISELFGKCLGYNTSLSEDQNYFIEEKNETDSGKADGAVKVNGEVVAVMEFKDTTTKNLKDVESQAFGYKNTHPKCNYIVTCNFKELWFYIDNTTSKEPFNLFNLSYDGFKLLWLCLSYESISTNLPEQIKNKSVTEEEGITKKLYSDYSLFRNEIFNDLVDKNPQFDKLLLFKKTQKLLDRFLFIFFAEDRLLLPTNSIAKIIKKWEDDIAFGEEKSLYTTFVFYFNLLNKGRPASKEREEIFAYNGGLFAPDEMLDSIVIDDELLSKHTKKLSSYDFISDVSVNILGHIFEHSLSQIEEIQNEIAGIETDKSKSKRKKDGVFYTPPYITKYIVENTVGKLCKEKREELEFNEAEFVKDRKGRQKNTLKKLSNQLDNYREWLLGITICDPACGSGAFLVEALNFLIDEHKYIDELRASLFGESIQFSDITASILENNLYGVDINEESVEIAKLSLWLRTAQKGRKLTSLSDNLKCGNSLIDDPEVAGDKAFNWENEFPEIFSKGGFDVVIGNPPYGANLSSKDWLKTKFKETSFGNIDSYKYFVQLGVEICAKLGTLGYIIPDSYLEKEYFKDLRKFVSNQFNNIYNIKLGDDVFDDVNLPTSILILQKKGFCSENYYYVDVSKLKKESKQFKLLNIKNFNLETPNVEKSFVSVNSIIDKKNTYPLIEIYNQVMGVKVYQKGKGIPKQTSFEKQNDVFISKIKSKEFSLPFISQGIKRYYYESQNEFISYGSWLAEPRDISNFVNPKIVIREIINPRIFGTYIGYDAVIKNIAAVITQKREDYSLKYLLSLLNSKLFNYYVSEQSPKSDNKSYPSFNSRLLKNLPIKRASEMTQNSLTNKVDLIIDFHNNFYVSIKKFNRSILRNFEIETLPKKLQEWHLLSFNEFLEELSKKKIKLSLSDESKWEDFFTQESKNVLEIKNLIDETDKEIDQMVYELYGLTQEEIEIVENATK